MTVTTAADEFRFVPVAVAKDSEGKLSAKARSVERLNGAAAP
jgi:hypothetical protein